MCHVERFDLGEQIGGGSVSKERKWLAPHQLGGAPSIIARSFSDHILGKLDLAAVKRCLLLTSCLYKPASRKFCNLHQPYTVFLECGTTFANCEKRRRISIALCIECAGQN